MTTHEQGYADCSQALSPARRTEAVVTAAVRAPKLTVADTSDAYAVSGNIFASMMPLAAPQLEVRYAASSTARDK